MRRDHLEHFIIGALIVLALGLPLVLLRVPGGPWIALALSVGVFYGREERDNEVWVTSQLRCNLEAIMLRWQVYAPWCWKRDGRWDAVCPWISATLVALALWWLSNWLAG